MSKVDTFCDRERGWLMPLMTYTQVKLECWRRYYELAADNWAPKDQIFFDRWSQYGTILNRMDIVGILARERLSRKGRYGKDNR